MKVAIISGSSIANSGLFDGWEARRVTTPYGEVAVKARGERVILNRHGAGVPLPPHSINFRANLRALADLGCKDVLSLNSVGSLRTDLPPGTLVSCRDYVSLQSAPSTYHDTEMTGGAPGIANNLLPDLMAQLAPEFAVVPDLVYVQTRGPRFETKAEIRILRQWGDVVGMTAGHEADLCTELGLNYNSLAMVDNYANGVEGSAIDYTRFHEMVRQNQERVNRLLARLLELLA